MPQKKSRPDKKKGGLSRNSSKASLGSTGSTDVESEVSSVFSKINVKGGKNEEIEENHGRQATGVLTSEPRARDVKVYPFSLSLFGTPLVEDTTIELNAGQRYGLVGRNGCGKSTFLQCLANREIPIPKLFDIYLLAGEAPPGEVSALDYVIQSAKDEIEKIDNMIEEILVNEGPESEALLQLYERQDELDESTFETRASTILVGLGFTPLADLSQGGSHIHKLTKDMSGGWRMRVALAKALFLAPSILLLDEPTNHLDLGACVWLEEYLSTYPKILVVTSHSQDFLNGVCTSMMIMENKQLKYWSGNFDVYIKTRADQETNQIKLYKKQQEEISDIKKFIASCGTYSNLVRQAKSRQKILDKMEADGFIEMPYQEPLFKFKFPDAGELAPPLISFSEVGFSYSGKVEDYLFNDISFGVHSNSRISLVGPNGAGKSTLIKLIVGELSACEGTISRRSGMSIGRFNQHSHEVLNDEDTPIDHISKKYQEKYPTNRLEEWRSVVGNYGIPKDYHLEPIKKLSDGLKTRLVFCDISLQKPHLLLLDEPTNAADMEMIDSLAEAINAFNGGVMVISHDFRLLSKISEEIWEVDHGVRVFDGDIRDFKKGLSKTIATKAAKIAKK